MWQRAAGREAAGMHPLSEALEGETAGLEWMGDSWAGFVFSSQHTISLNILSETNIIILLI